MKKIYAIMIIGVFIVFTSIKVFSQTFTNEKVMVIEPYPLAITFYKTSNLIFPYAIKSVDRGSNDILVQKAKGMENILQLKAAKQNFKETNLTVITSDGKFYSYTVIYSDSISALNIQFSNNGNDEDVKNLFPESMNDANIQTNAKKIMNEERTVFGVKDKKDGIKIQLLGVYIAEDIIYYQLKLQNHSNINYDIDQFRFFICDQKKLKRTAAQEIEIKPLYIEANRPAILGKTEQVFVFALPKFTIPDKKVLKVQLMEKNGGRHLKIKVRNKTIVRARLIQ